MKKLAKVKNFFYSSFNYIRGQASIRYFINGSIIRAVSFLKKINIFLLIVWIFIQNKDLPINRY